MPLRNHDTLTVGRIVVEARVLMAMFVETCEIQIRIRIQAQADGEVVSPASCVADRAVGQLEDDGAIGGVIERPALLRKLDKTNVSYRD